MKSGVKFATNLEFPFDHSKTMAAHSYHTKQAIINCNSNNRKKCCCIPMLLKSYNITAF